MSAISKKTTFVAMTSPQAWPTTPYAQSLLFTQLFTKIYGVLAFLHFIRMRLLGHHPRRSFQAQSPLVQLPIELLLEISDLLPAESSVALAVICTSLFGALFPNDKLHGNRLAELLQLLKRDSCKQLFFCEPCHILHRFSPSWKPGKRDRLDAPCRPEVVIRDGLHLGFNFARLAMNKHILGGGLNLEQLDCSLPNYFGGWNFRFTARVVQDELYLRVSHTLSLNGTGQKNRWQLENTRHGLCDYVTTHEPKTRLNFSARQRRLVISRQWLRKHDICAVPQQTRIPELALDLPQMPFGALKECRDAPGSCRVCLTDYSITTRSKEFSDISKSTTTSEPWEIVITAYHQLGPCRSQFDWKWLTFVTPLPDVCENNMDASLLGKRSNDGSYAPGSVKARWDGG